MHTVYQGIQSFRVGQEEETHCYFVCSWSMCHRFEIKIWISEVTKAVIENGSMWMDPWNKRVPCGHMVWSQNDLEKRFRFHQNFSGFHKNTESQKKFSFLFAENLIIFNEMFQQKIPFSQKAIKNKYIY